MIRKIINATKGYCADYSRDADAAQLAFYALIERWMTPKPDPALDLFFAKNLKHREHATWAIAHHENLYFAHAGILLDCRNSPHWSESRDRRMIGFLRRYRGRYVPTMSELREAELLTQKHGITIEAADTLVQVKLRRRSWATQMELIADDKADKLKDRDYYLVA